MRVRFYHCPVRLPVRGREIDSLVGLAGPSYSLGALSLGGSLQLATNLNIEETILMYTFATFFLAYSAAFLAGNRFSRDKFGAFFMATGIVKSKFLATIGNS